MLLSSLINSVKIRSTGRMSAKSMGPIIDVLDTSRTLYMYDLGRTPSNRELKFSSVQMMTMEMFVEIKKMGIAEYESMVNGRGAQKILENLRMPKVNGRYVAPSSGWLSEFRNHVYPEFRYELEAEIAAAVMKEMGGRVMTIDSTPLEASRYSSWRIPTDTTG